MIVLSVPKKVGRYRMDAIGFGPNGHSLAAPCGTAGLLIWDEVVVGRQPRVLKHAEVLLLDGPVEFRTDGRFVICGSNRGPVVWATDGTASVIIPASAYGALCRASFAPDESLALVDYRPGNDSKRAIIELRSLSDPSGERAIWTEHTWELVGHPPIISSDLATIAVYHMGIIDARNTRRFAVVTHDLHTGRVLRTSGPGPNLIGNFTFSLPNGLIAQRKAAQLRVWRVDSSNDWQQPLIELTNDQPRHFTAIAFHPAGKYLAATSNDETVKLYDTTTWEVAKTFTWNIGRMRSIAFSPDGALAAAGSDKGKVVVWDVDL